MKMDHRHIQFLNQSQLMQWNADFFLVTYSNLFLIPHKNKSIQYQLFYEC